MFIGPTVVGGTGGHFSVAQVFYVPDPTGGSASLSEFYDVCREDFILGRCLERQQLRHDRGGPLRRLRERLGPAVTGHLDRASSPAGGKWLDQGEYSALAAHPTRLILPEGGQVTKPSPHS
jgi:hypothetical protein